MHLIMIVMLWIVHLIMEITQSVSFLLDLSPWMSLLVIDVGIGQNVILIILVMSCLPCWNVMLGLSACGVHAHHHLCTCPDDLGSLHLSNAQDLIVHVHHVIDHDGDICHCDHLSSGLGELSATPPS